MEDKGLELIEKMYIEFTSFRKEVNQRFDGIDQRFEGIEKRLSKLEIGQERLDDKISEAFEAINTLAETNERQHQEILSELKGELNVVELAVKRIAK